MTQLLERPEVREAPDTLEVERAFPEAPPRKRPPLPPPRRDVRWIRWMVAITTVVVVAAAALIMVDTAEDPATLTTSEPLAELFVTEPATEIELGPATAGPITAGHPLAEVGVTPEIELGPATAGPITPRVPLPQVDVPSAPIAAAPIEGAYVPMIVSGSSNPFVYDPVPARSPEFGDTYIPSTVSGSSNPFVELGPAYQPDLTYAQPDIPGLTGMFGALEAEAAVREPILMLPFGNAEAAMMESVLPPQSPSLLERFGMLESEATYVPPNMGRVVYDPMELDFIESVTPGTTGRFIAAEAVAQTPISLALPFGAAETALMESVLPPQSPSLLERFGMLESEATYVPPNMGRVVYDPIELDFIESVMPGATGRFALEGEPILGALYEPDLRGLSRPSGMLVTGPIMG